MKSELPTVQKVSTSTMFPTKECTVSYTDFIYFFIKKKMWQFFKKDLIIKALGNY